MVIKTFAPASAVFPPRMNLKTPFWTRLLRLQNPQPSPRKKNPTSESGLRRCVAAIAAHILLKGRQF